MPGPASAKLHVKRVAWGLIGAGLLATLLVKPIWLFYPPAFVLWLAIVVYTYIQIYIYIQNSIEHTYKIPGTEIVLRTTFDPWIIAAAPYLEVRVGDAPPQRFCLAGPKLTRAQLYAVDGGGVLLERFWTPI